MRFWLLATATALCCATHAAAQPAERTAVIERVAQGVVRVRSERPEKLQSAAGADRSNEVSRFFDSFETSNRREEIGTGFAIDADGHVVTASFLLDGTEKIFIGLPSGEERPASLVAVDDVSMVAVLKADLAGLIPLSFSKSAPKQGEQVYSVAHAFGLPAALATAGMVAGANVDFPNERQRFHVLDMRINLGNAGAPVTDGAGRIVGMATANYGSGAGAGNLGIAVPGETVMDIAYRLIRDGRVARSAIGVIAKPLDRRAAGALIVHIDEESPADRAGLKTGDIVLKADGVSIADDMSLWRHIAALPIGSVVMLGYRRGGDMREAAVTTVERR